MAAVIPSRKKLPPLLCRRVDRALQPTLPPSAWPERQNIIENRFQQASSSKEKSDKSAYPMLS
jgi:hypothetical protein